MILAVMVFSFSAVGCSTAFKERLSAVKGPKGVHCEDPSMGPKGARPLTGFRNVQVGSIKDMFGGKVPTSLMRDLKPFIMERLADEGLPIGRGGKTLVINIEIFYYEGAGSSGVVFGSLEEVLAKVQLVDEAADQVVGKGICIGRTTSRVNLGVEKKTQGLANAIVDWIDERWPEHAGRVEPKKKK